MLYPPETFPGTYRTHVARGRSARAKVISAALTGAATGVWTFARWAAGGLGRAGRTIVSGVIQDHRRRVAIRQLHALDYRLLKDIGISRGQIPLVVEGRLAETRGAKTGSSESGEIAAFPHRQRIGSRTRKSVRRAA